MSLLPKDPTTITISTLTYAQLAKTIDHSLLQPYMTVDQVLEGCRLAARYDVASVCVKPADVRLATEALRGTDVAVGTVIGFPHGNSLPSIKTAEALQAIEDGATEIDVVINIGHLKSGLYDEIEEEIRQVVRSAKEKSHTVLTKIIIENAYLTDEEKVVACQRCERAGADFVKTSTGYAVPTDGRPYGATLEDLRLMRATVSDKVQVKAAGGVRTLDYWIEVLRTGTTRVGLSATEKLLDEFKEKRGL